MSKNFDLPDDNFHSPEPQIPYTPCPEAARIITVGIQTGYIPLPLAPDTPPEWVYCIMAVEGVAKTNRLTRWQSFVEAVSTFDPRMVQDVNQATEASIDRTEKDPILYETKDCMIDPPILDWVVDGLFARPSLNILVGDPGAKKTYLAIDLAACVANGIPWLGHAIGSKSTDFAPSGLVVGEQHATPIPYPALRDRASRPQVGEGEGQAVDVHGNAPDSTEEPVPNEPPELALSEANGLATRDGNTVIRIENLTTPETEHHIMQSPLSNGACLDPDRSEGERVGEEPVPSEPPQLAATRESGVRIFSPIPVFLVDEETGYLQLWGRLHATFHAHNSDWGARQRK